MHQMNPVASRKVAGKKGENPTKNELGLSLGQALSGLCSTVCGDRYLEMAPALLPACSIRHREGSVTANPWVWPTPCDAGEGASPGHTHFQNVLQLVTVNQVSV